MSTTPQERKMITGHLITGHLHCVHVLVCFPCDGCIHSTQHSMHSHTVHSTQSVVRVSGYLASSVRGHRCMYVCKSGCCMIEDRQIDVQILIFNVASLTNLIRAIPWRLFPRGPRLKWKVLLEYLRLQFESRAPLKQLCSTRQPPATPDDHRCIIYPDSLTWLGLTRGTVFRHFPHPRAPRAGLNPQPSVFKSGDLITLGHAPQQLILLVSHQTQPANCCNCKSN